jgi:hypothetical protein
VFQKTFLSQDTGVETLLTLAIDGIDCSKCSNTTQAVGVKCSVSDLRAYLKTLVIQKIQSILFVDNLRDRIDIKGVDCVNKTVTASVIVSDSPASGTFSQTSAYDTVSSFKVPQWIAETIDTRNKVLVAPNVEASVLAIASKLKHYKNDAKLFMAGLLETLEADVRSEFQTKRRMKDASQGVSVEVPFDETLVRYFWQEERTMLITEIVLASSVAGGGNYRAYEETAEMDDETRGSESKVLN